MGNECAKLIGTLIGIALFGLGTWGAYAIGTALGLCGFVGLMAGGGIIAAGLVGLCVVGVAVVAIASCCSSCFRSCGRSLQHSREQRAERRRQREAARQDTLRIQQGLGGGRGAAMNAAPVNQREYEVPPEYQQYNSNIQYPPAASAPPAPGHDYTYQPAKYGY